MIDSLQELNEVVSTVANRALDRVAELSTGGQRYVSYDDVSDLISKEDFDKYSDLIISELNSREEILEPVVMNDGELDVYISPRYCKFYQWIDGDEETFGCSFEEWLEKETKPIYHPLSLNRMAEIGEKAVAFMLNPDNLGLPLLAEDLGIQPEELEALSRETFDTADFVAGQDLYIGKWRVHIADTGEKHGTFMHLVNEGKPIVEFYDMTHIDPQFSPNGQFTTGRFYIDTILDKDGYGDINYPRGLLLQGDCPAWTVSHKEMLTVVSYLQSFEQYKATRKPQLDHMISFAEQKKDRSPDKDTSQNLTKGAQR